MESSSTDYLCDQPAVGPYGCAILEVGMTRDLKVVKATPELAGAVSGGPLLFGRHSEQMRQWLCPPCPIWNVLNEIDRT